jgi:hypothetical protein
MNSRQKELLMEKVRYAYSERFFAFDTSISPTIGPTELLTDGGLEIWDDASTPHTPWTHAHNGTSTVNREGTTKHGGTYSCRLDIDASGSNAYIDQVVTNLDKAWLFISAWGYASATNKYLSMQENNGTQAGPTFNPGAVWTNLAWTPYVSKANTIIGFKRSNTANASLYWDDISIKVISLPTCFGSKVYTIPAGDLLVRANVTLGLIGTRIGFWTNLDSTINPQNGVFCSTDGNRIFLEKVVNGIYTTYTAEDKTWIDGDELKLVRVGNVYTVYWNGTPVWGLSQTISDASVISNNSIVQFSTYGGNTFQDFFAKTGSIAALPTNITFNGTWDNGALGYQGWNSFQRYSINRISLVTSPTRKGLCSARFEVRSGDIVALGERSEVCNIQDDAGNIIYENLSSGTQYYAISILLPTNWIPPSGANLWSHFVQLHDPDVMGLSPAFTLNVDSVFSTSMQTGDMDINTTNIQYAHSYNALRSGEWIDFVFKIIYSKTVGTVDVWRRDYRKSFVNVLSLSGIPTLQWKTSVDGGTPGDHYWKTGIYRSNQTIINQLYLGGFVRGLTYDDVIAAAFS